MNFFQVEKYQIAVVLENQIDKNTGHNKQEISLKKIIDED